MKDPADTAAQPLIPEPKRRGRPPTGKAKSAADRKREQRQRARSDMFDAFGDPEKMRVIPTSTLCEGLSVYVSAGYPSVAGAIMRELARRACDAQVPAEGSYRWVEPAVTFEMVPWDA